MHDLLSLDRKRVYNLFRMDLHRMIHGKAFYVMVGITVFIPVMMLTQMSDVRDITMFIGSDVVSGGSFGAGMNLSMLNILTGMLLAIYIGKEYTTGFIKNMSMLMIAINLVFRRSYGWSIVFICIAATGIVVMSIQMGLQMLGLGALASVFNFTITGASAFTTTTPDVVSLLIVIFVSVAWTLVCSLIADLLMNKRDIL